MKIAFISYEYPPDTACGGIATYVYQASQLLKQRGHQVEVFAGSLHRYGTDVENGITVHRIVESDRTAFPKRIGLVFAERHLDIKFDVVEGPDIYAEAQEAIQHFPDLPLVVKIHTPTFLCRLIDYEASPLLIKTRRLIGLIRRGRNPFNPLQYNPKQDIEAIHAADADEVVILTQGMLAKVIKVWGIDTAKVSQMPNPYIPSAQLLEIPAETQTNTITFIGRVELRKGAIDFANAIPLVLQNHPHVKFRFVGKPLASPDPRLNMRQYLERLLWKYRHAVEFTGAVSANEIPAILASTDICVFPSVWENFPNVCLEAMAAARGVVGSTAGGMVEMLDQGKAGRLVPPQNSRKIAEAIIELVENPTLRMQLGEAARHRLLTEYNSEQVGRLLEESYSRAIQRRRQQGARHSTPLPLFVGATH